MDGKWREIARAPIGPAEYVLGFYIARLLLYYLVTSILYGGSYWAIAFDQRWIFTALVLGLATYYVAYRWLSGGVRIAIASLILFTFCWVEVFASPIRVHLRQPDFVLRFLLEGSLVGLCTHLVALAIRRGAERIWPSATRV